MLTKKRQPSDGRRLLSSLQAIRPVFIAGRSDSNYIASQLPCFCKSIRFFFRVGSPACNTFPCDISRAYAQ